MTETRLGEAAFDATRVARFLRAPDGALRVALVNLATGAEFGSLPLADRSREELARVAGIVRAMRDRAALAPPLRPAAPVIVARPEKVDRGDEDEARHLVMFIQNERDCYEATNRVAKAMSRGEYDREQAIVELQRNVVDRCSAKLRAIQREGEWDVSAHAPSTRRRVAELLAEIAADEYETPQIEVAEAPRPVPVSARPPPAPPKATSRARATTARAPSAAVAPPAPKGKTRSHALPDDVMDVLRRSALTANALTLPEQLDRKLYQKTSEALESIGAAWNRKAKAHVFGRDDSLAAFKTMMADGRYTTASDLAFFPTPPRLAEELVDLAGVREGDRVLEPSAGEGAIVAAAERRGAMVFAIEYDPRRAAVIAAKSPGAMVEVGDFLAFSPDATGGTFDAVVMNPPFALEGQPQADIDHVMHASRFVAPGGRLVAVMSGSVNFRDNAKSEAFRRFVKSHGGTIAPLPERSFGGSGTDANTVVVAFTMPGKPNRRLRMERF